jgi:polyisoprenoid-binding protein YceI
MRAQVIRLIAAATIAAVPLTGHTQAVGAPDVKRVVAGSYKVDPNHTQVVWTVDHMGVTPLSGAFGASGGTLDIDPAKPAAAKLNVTFNIAELSSTSTGFTKHLLSADLFDVAKNSNASFTSTSVQVSGTSAKIVGNLTIKGITKPVTLDAKFFGAGANPMSKKLNIGFSANAKIKRSDFGLGYGVPMVGDQVDLKIAGAFERVG